MRTCVLLCEPDKHRCRQRCVGILTGQVTGVHAATTAHKWSTVPSLCKVKALRQTARMQLMPAAVFQIHKLTRGTFTQRILLSKPAKHGLNHECLLLCRSPFDLQVIATNKVLSTQPYLCFFQGGPGFESPVPSEDISWLVRRQHDGTSLVAPACVMVTV